jgi:rhamnogalacturonyl hydrolase YesR
MDKTQVFNASLLGARLLARAYSYTKEESLKEEARKAVLFVCNHQQSNGAWAYGTLPFHSWIDNFHTGFNLECIFQYGQYTGDETFIPFLDKGFAYYINTFFCEDGAAKYYHNKLYPVDIHSPAQLIASLVKLNRFHEHKQIAEKVMNWTIKNMQDNEGFFYYQIKKSFSSKIPYMRWAQAWMFYAMCLYKKASTL